MPKSLKSAAKKYKTKPSRWWCFTWNNPDGEPQFNELEYCRYGVCQLEIGDSGTVHYQGYVELVRTVRLAHVNKWLPQASFSNLNGTREGAREYCMKEGRLEEPIEYGNWVPTTQGRRNDIHDLKATIDSGATLTEIFNKHPHEFLRYNRGIQLAQTLITKPRTFKTEVIVIYGPTGTGKSKWVYDNYDPETVYPKQRSNWWCGYMAHPVVLLDDFYGWLPFDEMLRLMDRYPLLVQTKGAQTHFLAKTLIITSNKQPWEWYNNEKVQQYMDPLYRRIDRWIYIPKEGEIYNFEKREDFERSVNEFNNN